ncbi:MAG TPA: hypothetical protein VN971_02440, partial [Thermoanaerobaculia bacterium]|nr:hypothetical protein [Thermoanaerobaculia bacterium]
MVVAESNPLHVICFPERYGELRAEGNLGRMPSRSRERLLRARPPPPPGNARQDDPVRNSRATLVLSRSVIHSVFEVRGAIQRRRRGGRMKKVFALSLVAVLCLAVVAVAGDDKMS